MKDLITIQSDFPVKETTDRLVSIIESNGMTVFVRLDHGANAIKQGLPLRPTELIIFGNPKVGTILMQDKQTTGIDLPVKALTWQDAKGKTWVTYNDMDWLADRHGLHAKTDSTLKAIREGMIFLVETATKK